MAHKSEILPEFVLEFINSDTLGVDVLVDSEDDPVIVAKSLVEAMGYKTLSPLTRYKRGPYKLVSGQKVVKLSEALEWIHRLDSGKNCKGKKRAKEFLKGVSEGGPIQMAILNFWRKPFNLDELSGYMPNWSKQEILEALYESPYVSSQIVEGLEEFRVDIDLWKT